MREFQQNCGASALARGLWSWYTDRDFVEFTHGGQNKSASVTTLFTETTLDGFPLCVVLLICGGVFLACFMDAIAGGGGIISVPVYLMAFSGLPTHFVLGTNKLSSCIGTAFSTARFIHQGYVHWRLFLPAAGLAVAGSVCGTQLQLHTPDVVLKYLLLAVLPV